MATVQRVVAAAFVACTLALAAAYPADVSGKCTLIKIAEWPVRSTTGSPVVDGAINGQKVGVLLDTGSNVTLILRAAAERLGLVRFPVRGAQMLGIGGETGVE